jgi:hypothetical protein
MSHAVIFAGPSLPPAARPVHSPIRWRPPIRQGELYRLVRDERPAAVGIVDGYFEVTPTVWHKEILWAMAEGIHVFGAASIGALRAAELASFGMRGIGRIYEDFRDGVLTDDDEVAILHGPAEIGYPPVTEAMTNIRATLAAATRDGIITPTAAHRLATTAKALFYKERTWRAVLGAAAAPGTDADVLTPFEAWLSTGRVDQKRSDGLALLEAISAHLAAGAPPLKVDYKLADTAAWRAVVHAADPSPSGIIGDATELS